MTIRLPLTAVTVFQFLEPQHLTRLAAMAKVIAKQPHEAVLMHGEPVPGIYLVGTGRAGVYPPGSSVAIAYLNQGEAFGEMSFLERNVASATIRAEDPATQVVILLKDDLLRYTEEDPSFGRGLYRGLALALSHKLRVTTGRISEELQASKDLFSELRGDTAAAVDLTTWPAELKAHNEAVLRALEGSLNVLAQVVPGLPAKGSPPDQLAQQLTAVRDLHLRYYAQLARQMVGITQFILRIEDSLIGAG